MHSINTPHEPLIPFEQRRRKERREKGREEGREGGTSDEARINKTKSTKALNWHK
jgi:hypothetical protein